MPLIFAHLNGKSISEESTNINTIRTKHPTQLEMVDAEDSSAVVTLWQTKDQ